MKLNCLNPVVCLLFSVITFCTVLSPRTPVFADETKVSENKVIVQLKNENAELKKQNGELAKNVKQLEQKNSDLGKIVEDQNKILTNLAQAKILTEKVWKPVKKEILDLMKRVEKRAKEVEKENSIK